MTRADDPRDDNIEGQPDIDATFDELVSRLAATPDLSAKTSGVRPEVGDGSTSPVDDGWDEFVEHDEPPAEPLTQEKFVPPPPPPLPRTDSLGTVAWIAAIGSPTLWIALSALGWPFEGWQLGLLVGGFLGGFGVLVSRMRRDHDDPDDGAVV